MTIYDSTVDAKSNIAPSGDTAEIAADTEAAVEELVGKDRRRILPIILATAAIAAVVAAGVYGTAKAVEARRSRSRWDALLRRF
ncbi:hypothetical protein [Actinoplanes sp. NPDC023714]|uniref:hypothetical protein n=1 Tax=Actinoplanes sp. NPDC023714 TaxID=3154322 RepID=UPI0033E673FD